MKCLPMWEPWATLMAIGAKRIETRDWATSHRGWMAIQATKGGLTQKALLETCLEEEFYKALNGYDAESEGFGPFQEQIAAVARHKKWITEVFPHGHIIAVVKLVDCLPTETVRCLPGVFEQHAKLDTPKERAFGDFAPGRWGWVTEQVFRLPEPIRYTAYQGMNDLKPAMVELIREQWRESKAKEPTPQEALEMLRADWEGGV